jgi:chemotaxis protein MotB
MARESKFEIKKPEEKEDWLLSYADMITLLLAFFVLMLSISKFDATKAEKVTGGLSKGIGGHDVVQPIDTLKAEAQQQAKALKLDDNQVTVSTDDRGMVLELDGGTFFDANSAELEAQFLPALTKMGQMLSAPKYADFQVEIDGHTDDQPVSTQAYPSNWELSAARASAVARLFIKQGMLPTRLEVVGFGDTRPKVANRDAQGRPLPANQAINRRVSVHVYHP